MLTPLLLGLAMGLVLGLTGAGGGILAVPLLLFGSHVGIVQAGPIALLAVGMAASLGAVLGLRAGLVRYRAALVIAASGAACSPVGMWVAHRSGSRWLGALFALTLLYVACTTFGKARAREACATGAQAGARACVCVRDAGTGRFIWTRPCARALIVSGACAGFLSGLLGVGGGFVMVPALRRYTDLPMASTVATSLAVIALVSATGVAASAASGTLAWDVAAPFASGALAGMLASRAASTRLSGVHLQIAFAAVAAAVALGMLARVALS